MIKKANHAGLDIAALQNRPSGYAVRKGKKTETKILYSDEEIIKQLLKDKIKTVAIDAPLSKPLKHHYRDCDIEVRKKGILIFSFNLPSLVMLANRAIKFKKKLAKLNINAVETYPHAVFKLNKKARLMAESKKFKTKHEKDAFLCLLVAENYSRGRAKFFGKKHKIWY